ncbi:MAG: hypothetical protein VW892_06970, partial [Flavobacteriaceae bacterium]
MRRTVFVLLFFALLSCENKPAQSTGLIYPEEVHFASLKQITFGGDNAEAYWSFDDQQIIFQSNNAQWGVGCD